VLDAARDLVRVAGPEDVLDAVAQRLAVAESLGATTVDVTRAHPATSLADLTGGRGADVVVDAVGSPEAFESSLAAVRRGGRVVVVGMYAAETVELQLGVCWARSIDVRFAGLCPVHAWWRWTMQLLLDGRLDPLPLVSHRLTLDDAPRGYAEFERRAASKVLLQP
jgi:threonine dehydrogenase-like Zn-dependent dehydrogenase